MACNEQLLHLEAPNYNQDGTPHIVPPPAIIAGNRKIMSTTAQTWHDLPQQLRNQRITDEARRELGQTGFNCKEWISHLIRRSSNGIITVPRTLPNATGFYWDYSANVTGLCGDIKIAQPGWAVQSRWRLNNGSISPHTFLIERMGAHDFTILEANWEKRYTVTRRTVHHTAFYSQVKQYTLYYFK